jgi:DNA-binding NtrC family response regulator
MNRQGELLLVDDETALLRSVSLSLEMAGLGPVLACDDPRTALRQLEARDVRAVVTDLAMPGMDGRELLARVRADHPDVPVLVMTGSNDLDLAVRCMQEGALDYLVKPVPDERLVSAVRRAFELRQMQQDIDRLARQLARPGKAGGRFPAILTQDAAMSSVLDHVLAFAPSMVPVLIAGEVGTGKSLLAAELHRVSGRPGPLVVATIGGVPWEQARPMLFAAGREGRVQAAAEGTLVLEGVDELDAATQVALLQLLDDGSYMPVGAATIRRNRARIVATCTHPLAEVMQAGRLRKDLFHRLHRQVPPLSPLRERLEDLPLLLPHFLGLAARALGRNTPTVPPDLYKLLRTHAFPGNLHELAGMCQEAVARHRGRMLATRVFREHIEAARGQGIAQVTPGDGAWPAGPLPHFRESHRALLIEAMRRAGGNQSVACGLLGMKRSTFNRQWNKKVLNQG